MLSSSVFFALLVASQGVALFQEKGGHQDVTWTRDLWTQQNSQGLAQVKASFIDNKRIKRHLVEVCGCDGTDVVACQCFFEEAETALCENVLQAGAVGLWESPHMDRTTANISQAEPNVPYAAIFVPSWQGAHRVDSNILLKGRTTGKRFAAELKEIQRTEDLSTQIYHVCRHVQEDAKHEECKKAAHNFLWCQKVEEGLVKRFGPDEVAKTAVEGDKVLQGTYEAVHPGVLEYGTGMHKVYKAAAGLSALGWMKAKDPAVQELRRSFLKNTHTIDKLDALCDTEDGKHVYDCKWRFADSMMCTLLEDVTNGPWNPKKYAQIEQFMFNQAQTPDEGGEGEYGIDWNYRSRMITHFRVAPAAMPKKSKNPLMVLKQKMQDGDEFAAIVDSSCEDSPRPNCKPAAKEALWCSMLAPALLKMKSATELADMVDKRIPCLGKLQSFGKGLGVAPVFGKMTC